MARSLAEVKKISRRTIRCLAQYLTVHSTYLFGSYVSGSATDESDIDLAIFSPTLRKLGLEEKINLISRVQRAVDAEVEIHLFSTKQLKQARPANFCGYILKNGKKICG